MAHTIDAQRGEVIDALNTAYTRAREDLLPLIPPGAVNVLDVGCSNGATGRRLKALRPGLRVTGLDFNAAAISEAVTVYDAAYRCDLEAEDCLAPIGDEQFDVILAPDVLEHLRDPERVLTALRSHLTPNGVIVVSLPNIRHWHAIATIVGGRFPREESGVFDATHLRWFTRHAAESLFKQCRMRVTDYRRVYRLTLNRRGGPLFPFLRMGGDFFVTQMLFRLQRAD